MADTVGRLAYEEATSAISLQSSTLDGLRARSGTLLAAASLVTGFLGGQALVAPTLENNAVVRGDVGAEGWIAIGFFVLVALLTLAILWPYKWRFEMGAKTILKANDFESTQSKLAEFHERNWDLNKKTLGRLFWCFRFACVFLAAETIAWIIDLGG